METLLYPQSEHSLIFLSSKLNKSDTSREEKTLQNIAAVLTEISQRYHGVNSRPAGPILPENFKSNLSDLL
jgi:hypothetical protein